MPVGFGPIVFLILWRDSKQPGFRIRNRGRCYALRLPKRIGCVPMACKLNPTKLSVNSTWRRAGNFNSLRGNLRNLRGLPSSTPATPRESRMVSGYCFADAVELLKKEGFENATHRRIYHAIVAGHIEPPAVSGSGCYMFSRRNLTQVRRYLQNVPKRGPRPAMQTA